MPTATVQIPCHFSCPISLQLMRDPVTLSTGHTYDRPSIQSWLATGNSTCPVTRLPLSDLTLIPNHTLRRLIHHWCLSNPSFGVQPIPATPMQPADPALIRFLFTQLSVPQSSSNLRLSAIRSLQALACDSDKNRSIMSSLSPVRPLIELAFASDLAHEALSLLVMFSFSDSDCICIASNPQRMKFLANLLLNASVEVRVNAAALIEIVIAGTKSSDHRLRCEISNIDGIFEGVVELLRSTISHSPRALKIGIKALFALCLVKQTRHRAVSAGAVSALIDRLAELDDKCDRERALATIELLCRIPEGTSEFVEHALAVPLLVKAILKIQNRTTEYAAGALLALCKESEKSRREAVSAGIIGRLLLIVQSECSNRAKRKAQMLLKLLRDCWPQQNSFAISDNFFCTQVFHY